MTRIILAVILLTFYQEALVQSIDFESISSSTIDLGKVADANEDFSDFSKLKTILQDVEIVMLGEQSHYDATTFETKIKLIKYLHQEMGFDLLVFESGLYDCDMAWKKIKEGEDVKMAFAKSVTYVWSSTFDLFPLVDYLEKVKDSDKPLELQGFDSQFTGKYAGIHFLDELTEMLQEIDPNVLTSSQWNSFRADVTLLLDLQFKELKKIDYDADLEFIDTMIRSLQSSNSDARVEFWIQSLRSLRAYYSDVVTDSYERDRQMADNLMWIKKRNPGRKIICWGATSHFLYNSKAVRMNSPVVQLLGGNFYKKEDMMGQYVKEVLNDKVYTIGFTTFEGRYGDEYNNHSIKEAKEGTLEHLLSQSEYDNYLLPLQDLELEGLKSRALGHRYMKTNINVVMDAVIFNRTMKQTRFNGKLYGQLNPHNRYFNQESKK